MKYKNHCDQFYHTWCDRHVICGVTWDHRLFRVFNFGHLRPGDPTRVDQALTCVKVISVVHRSLLDSQPSWCLLSGISNSPVGSLDMQYPDYQPLECPKKQLACKSSATALDGVTLGPPPSFALAFACQYLIPGHLPLKQLLHLLSPGNSQLK